jgi:hypothetical protein
MTFAQCGGYAEFAQPPRWALASQSWACLSPFSAWRRRQQQTLFNSVQPKLARDGAIDVVRAPTPCEARGCIGNQTELRENGYEEE